MTRISSPGWYWRTSEKAIPRPLNTEWYWPASISETTLRVVISSLRIRRMSSLGSMGLRDLDLVEDALDDLLRGELFGLRLVGEGDAVAEDVVADGLHVLRGHEAAVAEQGVSLGSLGEEDGGARRGAVGDVVLEVAQAVAGGFAGGEDDAEDVLLHLLVDVDLVHDAA